MTGLTKSDRCPIHGGSLVCCGRSSKPMSSKYGSGPVRRVPDDREPEGYRELCSPAELRRRKILLIKKQGGKCAVSGKAFTDFDSAELDHIEPKGMGSARRNDIMRNLRVILKSLNREKGSKRLPKKEESQ